jgi:diaminopimelate decarboxylase
MTVAVAPTLQPRIGELMASLLQDEPLLHAMVRACGSPLNVVIPEGVANNVRALRAVMTHHAITGGVWYACKVNRSDALLQAAALANVGVDASSEAEVKAAIASGIRPQDIGISGPLKDDRFLLLAARLGCTVTVDCLDELLRLARLVATLHLPRLPVLLRLSGFQITTHGRSEPRFPPEAENSRFGIPLSEIDAAIQLLGTPLVAASLEILGYAFHLDNLVVRDRVEAITRLVSIVDETRRRGINCEVIDMGGGFPVRYLEDGEWEEFQRTYLDALDRGAQFMFRNRSFGTTRSTAGEYHRGNFYYHDTPAWGAGFLDAVLGGVADDNSKTVAALLRDRGLRLIIEPGRAAIDQCGVTLCRVRGCRHSSGNDKLVVCDMNSSNLWEQGTGSEYTVDPVLLTCSVRGPHSNAPFVAHLVGRLCMESDVLAWRPVPLPREPIAGDLLVFVNTAGYQMDFVESPMHRVSMPRKVAAYRDPQYHWTWKLDDEFSQLDIVR